MYLIGLRLLLKSRLILYIRRDGIGINKSDDDFTVFQNKLSEPDELVLESVHRREGCREYWTRSKNHLAIKLKDKIELVNI